MVVVCSTCTCTVNQEFLWPQLLVQCFYLRCCKELWNYCNNNHTLWSYTVWLYCHWIAAWTNSNSISSFVDGCIQLKWSHTLIQFFPAVEFVGSKGEELEKIVCDLKDSVLSFKRKFSLLLGQPHDVIDISYQGMIVLSETKSLWKTIVINFRNSLQIQHFQSTIIFTSTPLEHLPCVLY